MTDSAEYEKLARETGAYKDIELDILHEAVAAWRESPGRPFTVLEVRDGRLLAGFAVLRREAGTEYTFDIQAIFVEPSYIGKEVAGTLVAMIETEILRAAGYAILRFETSAVKEKAIGTGLPVERGFVLIGHIPDFYGPGDDYFMYAKHLNRSRSDAGRGAKEGL